MLCVVVVAALGTTASAAPLPTSPDANYATIRTLLETPESRIDLAKAKLTIDRMIDPSIDVSATLSQLDAMARQLKAMLPPGASSRLTLDALRYHVYQASPWNGNAPFQYDLEDPLGLNIRNKLLTTYLSTRKGNCISMPMFFIIIGQKLGLDVTASLAPNHVFVKYRDSDGTYYNIETTSGAGFARDSWMRQQSPMTDKAIAAGIYMRPLTKKETVGVMVDTLLEFYGEQGFQEQRVKLARLVLQHSPRNVAVILHQHQAYLTIWRRDFANRYPTRGDVPVDQRPRLMELEGSLKSLFEQAYGLGWRPLDDATEAAYRARKGSVVTGKAIQQ